MAPRSGVLDGAPARPRRPDSVTAHPMRRPELLEPGLRVRRAATLLVITLLLPGSAQLVAGDRRLGRIAVKVWGGLVGLVLLLVLLALVHRSWVIALFTRPFVLGLVALVCFALAVVWPVLLVDAWRLGRMPLLPIRARRWFALALVVLILVTAYPMVFLGRRALAAEDFLGAVFSSSEKASADAGRYNVLLLGADSGKTRVGTRPDSITLASVDASTGRTALFSLPRNLENVPFPAGSPAAKLLPDGFSCGDECLINGIYTWATEHPEAFPGAKDPGAEAMKEAVSATLGIPVHYYVMIDLNGFRSLIDALGGIDLTLKERVPIGGGTSEVSGYLEPGRRHLNGFRALWYARSREGSSDYARMARQRCVMQAMLDQLDPPTVLRKFQRIADAGKDVVSTDIPAAHLATFLELGTKAKDLDVTSVQFVPPLITPAYADYGLIRSTVATTVADVEGSDETGSGKTSSGKTGSDKTGSGGTAPATTGGTARTSPAPSGGSSNGATGGSSNGATGGSSNGATGGSAGGGAAAVSVAQVCSA